MNDTGDLAGYTHFKARSFLGQYDLQCQNTTSPGKCVLPGSLQVSQLPLEPSITFGVAVEAQQEGKGSSSSRCKQRHGTPLSPSIPSSPPVAVLLLSLLHRMPRLDAMRGQSARPL